MAGLLTLGAAACGGDDGDDEATDESTTTTEVTDEETTTTVDDTDTTEADDETTTTVSGEGNTELEQLAQSLLITVDEVGLPGFQDLGYTPSPGPNQCGFDVDAEHPSEVVVGADYGTETLRFLQEIRVYATEEEAAAAFQAGIDGTQCAPADGTQISEPVDVTEPVGAQSAVAITGTQGDLEVVVVAALLSDAVVSFNFAGAPGAAEAEGAPNPVDVAAFGIGKIKAAFEANQAGN